MTKTRVGVVSLVSTGEHIVKVNLFNPFYFKDSRGKEIWSIDCPFCYRYLTDNKRRTREEFKSFASSPGWCLVSVPACSRCTSINSLIETLEN